MAIRNQCAHAQSCAAEFIVTTCTIFDDTACQLGEGALWHPERKQLFWIDIVGQTLFARSNAANDAQSWCFDEAISAMGWIDKEHLLIASETGLLRFNLASGKSETICEMETANPLTRSNDGRADPWGGFWVGTMGKNKEPMSGAIYRYFRGELRRLYGPLSIPNAICFGPDHRFAYFTDTDDGVIWRQPLDETTGWPKGDPISYLVLPKSDYRPDGAIIDEDGQFWCAQFGFSKLTCHDSDGRLVDQIDLPAPQITCPAFGGENMTTLFATSAAKPLSARARPELKTSGMTFALTVSARGQTEHRVTL